MTAQVLLKPPFTKDDIVEVMEVFRETTKIRAMDIVVTAGAACVLHGLRETTNDVDISIPYTQFSLLSRSKHVTKKQPVPGVTALIWRQMVDAVPHFSTRGDDITVIDGLQVFVPAALLVQYRTLNRAKDQDILRKLSELLG